YVPQLPPRPGLGGWLLPGWRIVLQVHYNFANTAAGGPLATDQSTVVAWRATQPVTDVPDVLTLGDWAFTLPAGQHDIARTVVGDVIPKAQVAVLGQVPEGLIYTTWAHEHLLGKSFRMDLVHADGSRQCLLDIGHWDFHWQGAYTFKTP